MTTLNLSQAINTRLETFIFTRSGGFIRHRKFFIMPDGLVYKIERDKIKGRTRKSQLSLMSNTYELLKKLGMHEIAYKEKEYKKDINNRICEGDMNERFNCGWYPANETEWQKHCDFINKKRI